MRNHRSCEDFKPLRLIVFVNALIMLSMTILFAQSSNETQSQPGKTSNPNPLDKPAFDDEPHFAVSGVKDTSALGGHGSDTMVRTRDSLAKETASLGKSDAALQRSVSAARLESIRARIQREPNNAELHHMLADAEEAADNPLAAVHEYQRAAELDVREDYIFDWGSELLLHHAPEPAVGVFAKGHRVAPKSARILIGMGVAAFTLGDYDKAVEEMSAASDIDPSNPTPYLFLGKMLDSENTPSNALTEKLRQFLSLQPDRADANYYYALALWKTRNNTGVLDASMKSLLNRAIYLDPKYPAAYLLRGIFYAEQGDDAKAIADYQQAISIDPRSEDAHYRLAQACRRTGDDDKAKVEIKTYEDLVKESGQQAEREHHEIRQFVYTLRDKAPTVSQ